jgi:hypothetical protein
MVPWDRLRATRRPVVSQWIADTIDYMEKNRLNTIEANPDAEVEFKNRNNTRIRLTLLAKTHNS